MKLKFATPTVWPRAKEAIQFAEALAKKRLQSHGEWTWNVTVIFRQPPPQRTAHVPDNKGYWGRACSPGNARGKGWVKLYVCQHLPPHAHEYVRYKGMPNFYIAGGLESIVYLAAHEFGHIIGWDGDKAGETSCCWFGYEAVMAWRERENLSPACLI